MTPQAFPDYVLEFDNLVNTDCMSRTGMLVHRSVKCFPKKGTLRQKGNSVVWIQVHPQGKKPFLVQSIYRQFQRLNRPGSDSISQQTLRWKETITKWEKASTENKQIVTVGDLNLNFFAWDLKPPQNGIPGQNLSQKMVENAKGKKIISQGHNSVNVKPTRNVRSTTERETCIDYIITNRVDKMTNHKKYTSHL